MFSMFDLVAPYGTALLGLVLGIWGFISARKLSAKVVCLVTALAFLIPVPVILVMRAKAREADYVLKDYNIRVLKGKINRCEKAEVKKWVDWTVDWWSNVYNRQDVIKVLGDYRIICWDQEKLSAFDRSMRGFTWSKQIVVGWNGEAGYTESLLKHELAHPILSGPGNMGWDEVVHHKKSKELGYPY